jgi:hypothetical protein
VSGALTLGELVQPGRVVLYAQPGTPWLIGAMLTSEEERWLERAGARVNIDRRSCLTMVEWPDDTLRDFMLYDVLCHELTHHALQVRPYVDTVKQSRILQV